MKCIILFALVAVCYAYPSSSGYRRSVNINDDGTIVITGVDGKKIVINKGTGSTGQRTVDISVSGPYIPTKRIQINENDQISLRREGEYNDVSDEYLRDKRSSKDKKQRTQADTLTKILKDYQGDIDQTTYQRLLGEINAAVQEGQLNSSVYDVLQSLNQGQLQPEAYIGRQQGILGSQKQGVLDLLREKAIERELQQEQQIQQLLQQQGQKSQQILDIPVVVDEQGRKFVERVLPRSQVTGLGLRGLSGIDDLGVVRQGLGGSSYITGTGLRTPWGVRDLLSSRQYGQTQLGPINQLEEFIVEERDILDGQRLVQQQQLQQQQRQRELLEQQLILQQQQQQQQRQQLLLQQLQEQQLQEQQRLLGRQDEEQIWREPLLVGDRSTIQTRGQQGLWQSLPGVNQQRGLWRGYDQGIPAFQRNNIPLIL